jgi:hypothetical protein
MRIWKWQAVAGAVALSVLAVIQVSAGQKTSGTTLTINTTTTVYDYSDGSGGGTTPNALPLLLHSDDFTGSGTGTCYGGIGALYQGTGGQNHVLSDLNNNGGLNLYLNSQTARRLWIDPTHPINPSQPTNVPAAGCYYNGVDMYGNCFDPSGTAIGLANLTLGSHTNCTLAVNFTPASVEYKLMLGPSNALPTSTCSSAGCPATGLATITCNKLDSTNSHCVDWTVANASAPNPDVANLYYYSSSRGTQTLVFVGQYYHSFLLHITQP